MAEESMALLAIILSMDMLMPTLPLMWTVGNPLPAGYLYIMAVLSVGGHNNNQ